MKKFELLASAVAVAMLVSAQPARAEWRQASTEKFEIYSAGDEQTLVDFARKIEDYDDVLSKLFPHKYMDSGEKLKIILVNSTKDLDVVGDNGGRVAGYYSASINDRYLIATRQRAREVDSAGDDTTMHEYAHHFLLQNFAISYPGWFVEGFAEYFQTIEFEGDVLRIGKSSPRFAFALDAEPLPWTDVIGKNVWRIPKDRWGAYYGQAWLLTHYFMSSSDRQKQLDQYLRAVAMGKDPVTAMQDVTGLTPEALGKELAFYRRSPIRFLQIKRPVPKPASVKVSVMPEVQGKLFLVAQRGKGAISAPDQKAYVELVRREAAPYPSDRFAQLVLARAETSFGDRVVGEKILEGLVASDPDDTEARTVLANSLLQRASGVDGAERRALGGRAVELLDQALSVAPQRYDILYSYSKALTVQKGPESNEVVPALLRALSLAPQVSAIRLAAGRAFIQRGRNDEGRAVLQVLVNAPHGSTYQVEAQKLLDKAGPGKAPSP